MAPGPKRNVPAIKCECASTCKRVATHQLEVRHVGSSKSIWWHCCEQHSSRLKAILEKQADFDVLDYSAIDS